MNKIKIIDLLNMISKGEEVPKKIKWGVHELDLSVYDYKAKDEFGNPSFTDLLENVFNRHALNDEVEILEEEPRDIEVCGSWFTKSEYDKLLNSEDEKKIPEKLDYFKSEEQLYNMSKIILFNDIVGKINEIIDYLKSKGE